MGRDAYPCRVASNRIDRTHAKHRFLHPSRRLPQAAREWLLHPAQPLGLGLGRWLEHAGVKALATTSAGYAFSRGQADRQVPVDEVLQHCHELVQATSLPVNVDFEDGYADDLATLADNVKRCVATGISALSIEDAKPNPPGELYALDEAVERMRVARGHRRGGSGRHAGGPRRVLPGRPARPGRDPATAERLRRGRRQLPVRAGPAHARGHRGGGEGDGAQAGEC